MTTLDGKTFERVALVVLDSLGAGEMPDAAAWGDAGSDTLGHICASRAVELPNLQRWGLGNIRPLAGVPPAESPLASVGRCALRSNGKDTTTGHWEMVGIVLEKAFPTYPVRGAKDKVILELRHEPAALDRFRHELRRMASTQTGSATLKGV